LTLGVIFIFLVLFKHSTFLIFQTAMGRVFVQKTASRILELVVGPEIEFCRCSDIA
jgi:hypothetical protein